MKKIILYIIFSILFIPVFSQSVFLSEENQYYDFLTLDGTLKSSTLNYKSLSDLNYNLNNVSLDKNIWNKIQFDNEKQITDSFSYKVFSPEFFMSYNTASPYGMNDEGLWQGKGFNLEFDTGIQLLYKGLEITFLPEITFSQNLPFEYMEPYYKGEKYEGKADIYGAYSLPSIDVPQRFGDESFFTFNFGQSEIRYSYKEFTVGFGTQSIWLGPTKLFPILHSNNAANYPKLDFGVRRKSLDIKDFWLGDIEFRYWMGYLHESKYFDNNPQNDSNLITGLSLAYEVPFLKGFSIGFNRTMLSKWNDISPYSMFTLLIPSMDKAAGYDQNDQRASIVANYEIPKGGINFYIEWAKNDYNTGFDNLIRYPFHTQAFTFGFDKALKYTDKLWAELLCEISYLETSMDYHFFYDWGGTGNNFYSHHIITQGYTNNGQYIGAGIGSGGNAQYLGFKIYHPQGSVNLFVQRANPDLNYSYFQDNAEDKTNDEKKQSIRATMDFGVEAVYFFTPKFHSKFSFVLRDEHNPLNENRKSKSVHRVNCHFGLWAKYIL